VDSQLFFWAVSEKKIGGELKWHIERVSSARCTKRHAPTVDKKRKFRSSQPKADPYTAGPVSRSAEDREADTRGFFERFTF
jgi:hypothetical protein